MTRIRSVAVALVTLTLFTAGAATSYAGAARVPTSPRLMAAAAGDDDDPPPSSRPRKRPTPTPSPAPAPAPAPSTGKFVCTVGATAVDRERRTGVVIESTNSGTWCKLRFADGTTRSYLTWMLAPAGGAEAPPPQGLDRGRYECAAGTGAGIQQSLMAIVIEDDSHYDDGRGGAGTYRYDPASRRITFASGPYAGQYAQALGPGKIGLASKPTTFFNMVCNKK